MRLRPYVIVAVIAAALAVTTNARHSTEGQEQAPEALDALGQTAETTAQDQPEPSQQDGSRDIDCAVSKCIALTYDDGPGPNTLEVADAFAERGQRATFFVVGNRIQIWPEELAEVAAQGHAIGLHTWDHSALPPLGAEGTRSQLQRTADAVRAAGGGEVVLFRPPYGSSDATVLALAADLGLSQVLWSVDSLDWQERDTDLLIRRLLDEAEPGAIVLMHDIHPSTVRATPAILEGLLAQGFKMVTVSELLGDPAPGTSYSARGGS